jgi:5-methylcytosine-specific restriction endonuclease McrA
MLREDRNAGFLSEGAWLWRRYCFCVGERASAALSPRRLERLERLQAEQPVCLLEDDGRRWWWFRDRFFSEADDLSPADVAALVLDRERRRRRTLERAHAALTAEQSRPRRRAIPEPVRRAVWERDGGRCAGCGSGFDLQYDHVIPHALGGADSVANLQLLCGSCNRAKGAGL